MSTAALIDHILEVEGGVSNNANDRGGLTNFGITQTTWEAYNKKVLGGKGPASVKNITRTDATSFYENWGKDFGLTGLSPVAYKLLFDFTVNSGYEAIRQYRKGFAALEGVLPLVLPQSIVVLAGKLGPLKEDERVFLNSFDDATVRMLLLVFRMTYLLRLVKTWFETHPAGSPCRNWQSAPSGSTCSRPGLHPSLLRGLLNRVLAPYMVGDAEDLILPFVKIIANKMIADGKAEKCPYLDPRATSFLAGNPLRAKLLPTLPAL